MQGLNQVRAAHDQVVTFLAHLHPPEQNTLPTLLALTPPPQITHVTHV